MLYREKVGFTSIYELLKVLDNQKGAPPFISEKNNP